MSRSSAPDVAPPGTIRTASRAALVVFALIAITWTLRGLSQEWGPIELSNVIIGVAGSAVAWSVLRIRRPSPNVALTAWLWLSVLNAPVADPWIASLRIVWVLVIGAVGAVATPRRLVRPFLISVVMAWAYLLAWTFPRLDPNLVLEAFGIHLVGLIVSGGIILGGRARMEAIIQHNRSLLDSVPVGLFRTSPDGTIEAANTTLATMLGVPTDADLLGRSAADFYPSEAHRRHLVSRIEQSDTDGLTYELVTDDGRSIWVQERLRVIRDHLGETIAFEGALLDVTSRREAELEAEQASGLFTAAFDHAPVGMALMRPSGEIVRTNDEFRSLVSVDGANTPPARWQDMAGDDPVWSLLLDGLDDHRQIDHRLVGADGSERWVRAGVSSVVGHDGPYLVAQILDITSQKHLQMSLEERVREKDQFVASVSHELRTPLTAVLGFTSMLNDRAGELGDEERAEILALVHEQSTSVSNIVEDLLVAARADIGQLRMNPSTIDLAELSRQAVDDCAVQRPDNRPVPVIGEAECWADPLRVRQILRNLVTNAYRYGGSSVEIRIGSNHHHAHVHVMDDGEGIADGEIEEVFEPYRRAHDRRGVTGSIGLGLAVSRTLAQAMGGTLGYRRTGDHSVFEVVMPTPAAVGQAPESPTVP